MTTRTILHTLRRFIATRGCPTWIVCDNAQSFKSIAECYSSLSPQANIDKDIKFIPSLSPWGNHNPSERSGSYCEYSSITYNTDDRDYLPLRPIDFLYPYANSWILSRRDIRRMDTSQWKMGQVVGSRDDFKRSVQIRLPSRRIITRPNNMIYKLKIQSAKPSQAQPTIPTPSHHQMVTRSKARQQTMNVLLCITLLSSIHFARRRKQYSMQLTAHRKESQSQIYE
ncbi:unnamed protein product [Strongylus vulgaris]|uniref:Integrase catalytic domain-containing protein n=1 Tax=Strongylus vulgaris TaxID=40348 RepID=A0A3P7KCN9_STRVU|nr:unnamed protein product [Strongylus vulgaris]